MTKTRVLSIKLDSWSVPSLMTVGSDGCLHYGFLPQNIGEYNPRYHKIVKEYGYIDSDDEQAWEDLQLRFVRDNPPDTGIGDNGWLLPDGTMYTCGPYEHDSIVSYIYRYVHGYIPDEYPEVSFVSHVEQSGWIRIRKRFVSIIKDPTREQVEVLFELYARSEDSDFRRHLKWELEEYETTI